MPLNDSFLLVSGPDDEYWQQVLEETIAPLGKLQVVTEELAIRHILQHGYTAIFVDVGKVSNFALLTSRIRAQRPEARVIVVATNTSWERAREAFRSGATDYICKAVEKEDLLSSVEGALSKRVLPWPR
jgi:DNA-binding NtrC family response regulator